METHALVKTTLKDEAKDKGLGPGKINQNVRSATKNNQPHEKAT